MTREEVAEKITPIAREVFAQPELVLRDDVSADNLPTWTSLSFTQFLTEIENQFGFKFKMMELLKMQNMGAIIETVLKHLS